MLLGCARLRWRHHQTHVSIKLKGFPQSLLSCMLGDETFKLNFSKRRKGACDDDGKEGKASWRASRVKGFMSNGGFSITITLWDAEKSCKLMMSSTILRLLCTDDDEDLNSKAEGCSNLEVGKVFPARELAQQRERLMIKLFLVTKCFLRRITSVCSIYFTHTRSCVQQHQQTHISGQTTHEYAWNELSVIAKASFPFFPFVQRTQLTVDEEECILRFFSFTS